MHKVIIVEPNVTPEQNKQAIKNSLNVLTRMLRGENLIAANEYIDCDWDAINMDENYIPKTHTYYY